MDHETTNKQANTIAPGTDYRKPDVENLVEQAMRGDRDALELLCQTIAKNILFRVMRKIHSRSDAEDTAQEVLVRVCENISGLRDPKAFGGWLNSIIINETNRHLAKNVKHGSVLFIDDYVNTASDENEDNLPLEYALKAEDRKAVMEIVDELPDRQQEAVMLHYYEGMNVTETAKAMSVSKPTVSIYLTRAREKIKKELIKKQRKTGVLGGVALLPLGSLLARVFFEETALLNPLKGELAGSAISDAIIAYDTSVAAALAADAVALGSKMSGLLLGTITAVAAVIVIVGGMWFGGVFRESGNAAKPQIEEFVEGRIMFSDGDDTQSSVNPRSATVWGKNKFGELTPLKWQVTALGGEKVLYGGEGGVVDEALAGMQEREENGEYMLSFFMTSEIEVGYRLDRQFTIRVG